MESQPRSPKHPNEPVMPLDHYFGRKFFQHKS